MPCYLRMLNMMIRAIFFSPLRWAMFPLWSILPDLLLGLICVGGDRLLQEPDIARVAWMRALVDSSTHGAVGLVSWMVVLGRGCRVDGTKEIFLCGLLASLVDTDHFLAARSWKLKDALSLNARPPFHNTTLLILIFLVLLILQRNNGSSGLMDNIAWIFLVAWFSHHLRDANRRGLWFWPFGSTRPLPRCIYLGSIMMLPLVVRVIIIGYTDNGSKLESNSRLAEVILQT